MSPSNRGDARLMARLEAQARGSCDFFLEHAGTSQLPLRTEEDFVPEDSPEVEWHHQRLAEFARQGAGENAREVLLEMMETGLLPGPKAYHAAVYACAAAGDPVGGVSVLRRRQLRRPAPMLPPP